MPWFRTRTVGDDDVVFSVKKRIWWTLWLFSTYEDYSTSRAVINKIDTEIIELIGKIEAKLSSRMVFAEAAAAEYKNAVNNRYDNFGVSKPTFIDDKVFDERVKPYVKRPDEKTILEFLNPMTLRKFNFNVKPTSQQNQNSRQAGGSMGRPYVAGTSGSDIAIVDESFRKHATHLKDGLPVDSVIFAKDEKKGAQPEGKKAQMAKLRQANPYDPNTWENHNEWNKYLEQLWKEKYQDQ